MPGSRACARRRRLSTGLSADGRLGSLLNHWPVAPVAEPDERSRNLREIRRALARSGCLALAVPARDGGSGHPATVQVLLQFVCGYHDVNLRDSTGLGHGLLIAAHAGPQARDQWLPCLLAGAVPGIAVTEPHGGSQVHATATHATPAAGGTWRVTGTKTWISRLTEAAVFCAFFTAPDGGLTAAAIDARADGLSRKLITPAGLSGWSWGELRFDGVTVRPCEILGQPGEGMSLLRDHFARYRPLVTATALGAAAAVHDQTAGLLASRCQDQCLPGRPSLARSVTRSGAPSTVKARQEAWSSNPAPDMTRSLRCSATMAAS